MSLLGGDKDGPNEPPEHGSKSCGRVVGGMVVQATAVSSRFVTLGSTPLLSVGEPVFGQNLLSHFAIVPRTGCSKFVLVPPFPEHGLKEGECGCSW